MAFQTPKTVEQVLKEIHARKYLMPAHNHPGCRPPLAHRLTSRPPRSASGRVAGRPGTSAQVTMTDTGTVPATGTVLWSLLATDPDGKSIELGYKTLRGQKDIDTC
jgi:hypothetical protein